MAGSFGIAGLCKSLRITTANIYVYFFSFGVGSGGFIRCLIGERNFSSRKNLDICDFFKLMKSFVAIETDIRRLYDLKGR